MDSSPDVIEAMQSSLVTTSEPIDPSSREDSLPAGSSTTVQSSSEDLAKHIIVRKRKMRHNMREGSVEESKNELFALKERRDISPATKLCFEQIIVAVDDLKGCKKTSKAYNWKVINILRLEEMLDNKFKRDAKYREELKEFRALMASNILIRYGDYMKSNLNELKKKNAGLVKAGREDLLRGKSWKEVLIEIEREDSRFKVWEKAFFAGKHPTRDTPMMSLIEELAALCIMDYDNVIYQIGSYTKRCEFAHSGVDEAIEEEKWHTVAEYIIRDKCAIENGVLPYEMKDEAGPILEALMLYQSRYFKRIQTQIHPGNGLVIPRNYTLSDEVVKKQEAAAAAEEKREAQRLNFEAMRRTIEEAEKGKFEKNHYMLAEATQGLLDANSQCMERKADGKLCQRRIAKSESDVKEKARKFRRIQSWLESGELEDINLEMSVDERGDNSCEL